jgi:hypothetical protein
LAGDSSSAFHQDDAPKSPFRLTPNVAVEESDYYKDLKKVDTLQGIIAEINSGSLDAPWAF